MSWDALAAPSRSLCSLQGPGVWLQGAQQELPGPCCPQGPSPKVVAPVLALVVVAVQSQEFLWNPQLGVRVGKEPINGGKWPWGVQTLLEKALCDF